MNNSYNSGFKGFEIDLFYYKKNIIVSHEKPRPGVKYLKIQDFLNGINFQDSDTNLWLDLKNLNYTNCTKVAEILKGILQKRNIINSTFVESKKSLLGLNCLRKNGIHGVYWVEPARLFFLNDIKYRVINYLTKYFNIHGVSFSKALISEKFLTYFEGQNMHVFTVNKTANIDKLNKDERIKSILTDQNKSF
jgi:hypothetical protein